ncbi:hypothetical protein [Brevibacillus daliensis]|uniref:hypothetical protein n=1 Tax=Brevibacillus daliensis TaxID=2892995 RepID=UPI001E518D04|nr:hypothetical protein [Brevibacillus daliensis]
MIWANKMTRKRLSLIWMMLLCLFSSNQTVAANPVIAGEGNRPTSNQRITWLLHHEEDTGGVNLLKLQAILASYEGNVQLVNVDRQSAPTGDEQVTHLVYAGDAYHQQHEIEEDWKRWIKNRNLPLYLLDMTDEEIVEIAGITRSGMSVQNVIVEYNGLTHPLTSSVDVHRYKFKPEANAKQSDNPKQKTTVMAYLSNVEEKTPYLLLLTEQGSGRKIYICSRFMGDGELAYVIADSIQRFYDDQQTREHQLHILIGDNDPESDPQKLWNQAKYLHDEGIPFSIAMETSQLVASNSKQLLTIQRIQQELDGQVVPILQSPAELRQLNKLIEQNWNISTIQLSGFAVTPDIATQIPGQIEQIIGTSFKKTSTLPAFTTPLPTTYQGKEERVALISELPLPEGLQVYSPSYVSSVVQEVDKSMIAAQTNMVLPLPYNMSKQSLSDLIMELKGRGITFAVPKDGGDLSGEDQNTVGEHTVNHEQNEARAGIKQVSFYISWGLVVIVTGVVILFFIQVRILRRKRAQRMFENKGKAVDKD